MDTRTTMFFNFRLAISLAWKSVRHHRLVSFATILGVATGMCVVTTILIVDHNTARTDNRQEQLTEALAIETQGSAHVLELPITKIAIRKQLDSAAPDVTLSRSRLPTQQLPTPLAAGDAPAPAGEEDYQTMRLAIRLASMFAFFIGSVIVFYTMRFSVAMRIREFALLQCLGEHQRNVSLSLITESLILGACGTLCGLLFAYPAAKLLLRLGISTTGRAPALSFSIPYPEIAAMVCISLLIVLLGVISPVRTIYRFQISQVLQPRLIEGDIKTGAFQYTGFSWLLPPLLLASYLAVRPFLESWLSVVYFFLLEAVFVVVLTLVTLWLTRPFLRIVIHLIEMALQRLMPLETLLTVRRIRLTSHKFVLSITGVILVFGMLGGLHSVTRSLKNEIYHWSTEAIAPYFFYLRATNRALSDADVLTLERRHGLHIFRLSREIKGSFPMRLINARDFNRYREKHGEALFAPGQVIFSRTLAARFGVTAGDTLHIETGSAQYQFDVIEVSDAVGTFAQDAQYVDIKSFALFTDGNPLFRDNLEYTLGDIAVARRAGRTAATPAGYQRHSLYPYYRFYRSGRHLKNWQLREIDRDFLIFDFILLMTIILAFIGVVNTLLIQVHSRGRELSVLKTLGMDRPQMFRLLLVEGLVIGLVGAALALVLGTALGVVSVSFLDHFTLFEYEYLWSARASVLISGLAIFTCCASAVYPAIAATRISTAESLHYE